MPTSIATRTFAAAVILLASGTAFHARGAAAQGAPAAHYDVLIRGGRVLDGTGNPWMLADVGIRGDRVVAVGRLAGSTAATILDADGKYVAPGFIDTHSHAGGSLARRQLSGAAQLLAQGLTTVFVNPDGGGSTDLVKQRQDLLAHGLGLNVALMVPHGSIRGAVIGSADRAPSPAEMDRMKAMVDAGMQAGAFALSSGPFYAPGSFARTSELVELARVAAKYGAPYQSHIRDESDYGIGLLAAVEEVITVAREAGTRGVVTHIKALGPNVWGFSAAIVQRIERARAEGVEVFADQYPYEASSTSLAAALVPRWAQAGGDSAFDRRMRAPAERTRILAEMHDNLARRGGAARIQVASYGPDRTVEGRTLAQIAAARGTGAVETALALLDRGSVSIVSFNMHDDDIERLMVQPWTMTSSDGTLTALGAGVPHPRGNGAFPRKIRRYVLDEPVMGLADAVRSMTSLPASVYRMVDRGVLRPGAIADVVVFDLDAVRDMATFENPHQVATGMVHVLVNGQLAWRDGKVTDTMHGTVLARP